MTRRPSATSGAGSAAAARRHGWLELVAVSGPFLTVPVADETWPTGIPAVTQPVRAEIRAGLTQLLDDHGASRVAFARLVFTEALGWGDALAEGAQLPASLAEIIVDPGVLLRPDFAFRVPDDLVDGVTDQVGDELAVDATPSHDEDEDDDEEDEEDDGEDGSGELGVTAEDDQPFRLLGMWTPWGTHPLRRVVQAGWAASPVERLAALLRARGVPVGLVSDGRWWAVVWAPPGKPVGAAVWDASLWCEEPETFAAFVALLERRRFLGVGSRERLPALLARSAEAQEEVTTALGGQVRAAVEMLVRKLDELDRASTPPGSLLGGESDDDLYAAVVTVMMRVVFLLFAEERRLLRSDDARYDAAYSVARLVEQLEQRAAIHGEATLEHRTGAWHRLCALARALFGGVAHQDLRLPAYGGALFDPARYPWLEGAEHDTGHTEPAPVDDRTVLRILEAVQYVRLGGERRRLSFRALDVEQIGYVYEGLLTQEVRTATAAVLHLGRGESKPHGRQRKQPRKGVDHLDVEAAADLIAEDRFVDWVASAYLGKRASAASRKQAEKLLAAAVPPAVAEGLRTELGRELAERLGAISPLLRRDDRGRPYLTPAGGRYVAQSTRRASTGAHYTPRSLAEEVVRHALEPLAYQPGPLETLERDAWVPRPSTELLTLRVADIAMGSGAFLVAACRFLADRLVEAWDREGDREAAGALAQRVTETADTEVEAVVLRARRLVAERCLYGVDINPLAVEMAKLSLWLVTMDRERPFGFLDDRLVCGDSLLGLTAMDQLATLHVDPAAGRRLQRGTFDFNTGWRAALARSADARRRITATTVTTVRDVDHKTRLLAEADAAAEPLRGVADALTGAGLAAAATKAAKSRDQIFTRLSDAVWAADTGDTSALESFADGLNAGLPAGKEARRPLHWPLAFPEVFADTVTPGFDSIIGNPPFLGGKKISGSLGDDYLAWLAAWDGRGVKGVTDLAARFLLRADALLGRRGQLGYVTTNTVIEGDTLAVGLLQLEQQRWTVRRGVSPHPWPSSSASLSVVEIWASKAPCAAPPVLDDEPVPRLGVDLQPYLRETGRPVSLAENEDVAFQGSNVLGPGFTMGSEEARQLIDADPRSADVLFPYVIGADLNRRPDTSASRWIINFRDWPLERAEEYPVLIDRVRRLVKPERERKKAADYRKYWWRYARRGADLYEAIADLDHVLAISLVGNALLPVRVPTGQVFAHACAVFAVDDFASLAVLSSSAHQIWVIRYTSTMRTDIRYAPSDVLVTFPRPPPTVELHKLGEVLDTERREVMLERALGLTKLYNLVHDPSVTDPAITSLRALHERIDHAVLAAYGWDDFDPRVGHHPTKIGTRWTFSPQARFELLDRLLVENHRRAETS